MNPVARKTVSLVRFPYELRALARRVEAAARANAVKAGRDAAKHLERAPRRAKPPPIATGEFVRSWRSSSPKPGQVVVENVAPHAGFVERGRKKGRPPPVAAIRRWALVKGLSPHIAWPVARAIGRRGVKGRWILRDARPAIERLFRDALARAVRGLEP